MDTVKTEQPMKSSVVVLDELPAQSINEKLAVHLRKSLYSQCLPERPRNMGNFGRVTTNLLPGYSHIDASAIK